MLEVIYIFEMTWHHSGGVFMM